MKNNFYLFFAFLGIFSCDLEVPLPDAEIDAVQSPIKIRLGGDDWIASKGAPISGKTNADQGFLIAYSVFLQLEDGSEEYVLSGINLEIQNVNFILEQGRRYRMEVSASSWPTDFDPDRQLKLFNFEKGSLSEFFDIEINAPDWNKDHIIPFKTYIDGYREGVYIRNMTWYDTDKFVGEVDFVVEADNQEISIEMYRFSSGLSFRVENLQEGQVEFEVSEYHDAFNLFTDVVNNEVSTIRPLYSIYNWPSLFTNSEFSHDTNTLRQYPVKAYLIEGGERKLLLNASVELKRNFNRTYILDMGPFYQEIDKTGGEITLDFVDTDWGEEYTFDF